MSRMLHNHHTHVIYSRFLATGSEPVSMPRLTSPFLYSFQLYNLFYTYTVLLEESATYLLEEIKTILMSYFMFFKTF